MADFVKEHKRNVRFSVNRSAKIYIKLSKTEVDQWLMLRKVLNDRRNTGNEIETFLYLLRKYETRMKPNVNFLKRNNPYSVERNTGILFKVNEDEEKLWLKCVGKFKSSKVSTFLYIIDQEYFFQDNLEPINEGEPIIEEEL